MEYNEYRTKKKYNMVAFSFGGGVQSTALLMLINHNPQLLLNKVGHIPDYAYFADTGLEPEIVYEHIDKLENDNLFDFMPLRKIETKLYDHLYSPPYFVVDENKKVSQLRRQCTGNHKIKPIRKSIREDYKKQQNYSLKSNSVGMWLGISTDEIQRMKESHLKYIEAIFPLIEIGWSRNDCYQYLESLGWNNVPKSACYMCPYSNWKKIKKERPDDFEKAVEFENWLINNYKDIKYLKNRTGTPMINNKGIPLSEQNFSKIAENDDYMNEECDGMCGL